MISIEITTRFDIFQEIFNVTFSQKTKRIKETTKSIQNMIYNLKLNFKKQNLVKFKRFLQFKKASERTVPD